MDEELEQKSAVAAGEAEQEFERATEKIKQTTMGKIKRKLKKIYKKARKLLKKMFKFHYFLNGYFVAYIPIPFLFDSRLMFALRHATKPVNPRKIVFENFQGRGYGCNPKYIAEKLEAKYPGKYKLVWLVSKDDAVWGGIPEHIKKVRSKTQAALRELATAKVYVSNHSKVFYMRRGYFKRTGQYHIQTWHGSLGIKRIGNDIQGAEETGWRKMAKRSSNTIDFWISNSDFESGVYEQAYWAPQDRMLLYGHPRNDILFHGTQAATEKVKKYFGISADKKILFYAPTFRDHFNAKCYEIDFERLRQALGMRFGGEWVVLERMHPKARKYIGALHSSIFGVYNASDYSDIQELIASADCMISDYSSCIFDFMLTKRPGFIFATDIEEYNTERGFYYPLESTPFPIACSNEELIERIEDFDESAYQKRVEDFLKEKGCVEDGYAAERVAELINQLVEREGHNA